VGTNKEIVFDYYLDYKGNIYDKTATPLVKPEELSALKEAKNGAYLGRATDPQGLTEEAKASFKKLSESGLGGKRATILETGNGTAGTPGWLRVRDAAGITGVEIARVSVGQEYPVLEEATGWVKIKVSETVQGWVSATYVKITGN